MAEWMIFVLSFVSCSMNLGGWIAAVTAENNNKQFALGMALLATSVAIPFWMILWR